VAHKTGLEVKRFHRAATQRLTAAELLFEHEFYLESNYLAGYGVECALKCLILKRTPRGEFSDMLRKVTQVGAKGHDFEYLKDILKRSPISCTLPRDLRGAFLTVASWSADLRYEVGQVKLRDARRFLEAAQQIYVWTERS
jgi:hypothetical protein